MGRPSPLPGGGGSIGDAADHFVMEASERLEHRQGDDPSFTSIEEDSLCDSLVKESYYGGSNTGVDEGP